MNIERAARILYVRIAVGSSRGVVATRFIVDTISMELPFATPLLYLQHEVDTGISQPMRVVNNGTNLYHRVRHARGRDMRAIWSMSVYGIGWVDRGDTNQTN